MPKITPIEQVQGDNWEIPCTVTLPDVGTLTGVTISCDIVRSGESVALTPVVTNAGAREFTLNLTKEASANLDVGLWKGQIHFSKDDDRDTPVDFFYIKVIEDI